MTVSTVVPVVPQEVAANTSGGDGNAAGNSSAEPAPIPLSAPTAAPDPSGAAEPPLITGEISPLNLDDSGPSTITMVASPNEAGGGPSASTATGYESAAGPVGSVPESVQLAIQNGVDSSMAAIAMITGRVAKIEAQVDGMPEAEAWSQMENSVTVTSEALADLEGQVFSNWEGGDAALKNAVTGLETSLAKVVEDQKTTTDSLRKEIALLRAGMSGKNSMENLTTKRQLDNLTLDVQTMLNRASSDINSLSELVQQTRRDHEAAMDELWREVTQRIDEAMRHTLGATTADTTQANEPNPAEEGSRLFYESPDILSPIPEESPPDADARQSSAVGALHQEILGRAKRTLDISKSDRSGDARQRTRGSTSRSPPRSLNGAAMRTIFALDDDDELLEAPKLDAMGIALAGYQLHPCDAADVPGLQKAAERLTARLGTKSSTLHDGMVMAVHPCITSPDATAGVGEERLFVRLSWEVDGQASSDAELRHWTMSRLLELAREVGTKVSSISPTWHVGSVVLDAVISAAGSAVTTWRGGASDAQRSKFRAPELPLIKLVASSKAAAAASQEFQYLEATLIQVGTGSPLDAWDMLRKSYAEGGLQGDWKRAFQTVERAVTQVTRRLHEDSSDISMLSEADRLCVQLNRETNRYTMNWSGVIRCFKTQARQFLGLTSALAEVNVAEKHLLALRLEDESSKSLIDFVTAFEVRFEEVRVARRDANSPTAPVSQLPPLSDRQPCSAEIQLQIYKKLIGDQDATGRSPMRISESLRRRWLVKVGDAAAADGVDFSTAEMRVHLGGVLSWLRLNAEMAERIETTTDGTVRNAGTGPPDAGETGSEHDEEEAGPELEEEESDPGFKTSPIICRAASVENIPFRLAAGFSGVVCGGRHPFSACLELRRAYLKDGIAEPDAVTLGGPCANCGGVVPTELNKWGRKTKVAACACDARFWKKRCAVYSTGCDMIWYGPTSMIHEMGRPPLSMQNVQEMIESRAKKHGMAKGGGKGRDWKKTRHVAGVAAEEDDPRPEAEPQTTYDGAPLPGAL